MNNKAQVGGRFTALLILLLIAVVVGFALPPVLSDFEDVSSPNNASAVYGVSTFFSQGINWSISIPVFPDPTITLDFFGFLPDSIESYFDDYFNIFTYIPDPLAVALYIIMAACLIYIIVTLVIPAAGG